MKRVDCCDPHCVVQCCQMLPNIGGADLWLSHHRTRGSFVTVPFIDMAVIASPRSSVRKELLVIVPVSACFGARRVATILQVVKCRGTCSRGSMFGELVRPLLSLIGNQSTTHSWFSCKPSRPFGFRELAPAPKLRLYVLAFYSIRLIRETTT